MALDRLCQDVGIIGPRIVVTGDSNRVRYGGQGGNDASHIFIRGYAEDEMHPPAGKQLREGLPQAHSRFHRMRAIEQDPGGPAQDF